MGHIAILRLNLTKFLISGQDQQFPNIIFKINKLELLWVPNFIALGIYFIFGTKFFWNVGLILVLMSNMRYLVVILIFLWFLVVTAHYCSLLGGYCSLLLVPTFNMNSRKLLKKNLEYESILYNSTELSVDLTSREFQNQTILFMLFSRKIKSSNKAVLKLLSPFNICF